MAEKKLGSHCIIMLILASMLWTVVVDSAAVANTQYSLDLRSDCISVGFLDVPRDQLIYVRGRSGASTGQQQLSCYLQFNPQTDGDTLKMWLEPGAVVSDCDVTLELQMSNSDKYTLGCRTNANSIPTMEMVNGKASIRLIRKTYDDTDFSFQIGVSAKRSVADVTPGDSSSGNTGMIVGIVAGIIAIIIIAIVVCVCCYRKHHNGEIFRSKKDLPKDQSFGYENSSMKVNSHDSLGSERKLLPADDLKPRSALERFGPPPKSQQPTSRVYEERMVARGRNGVDGRDVGSRYNETGGEQKQGMRKETMGGGARENNAAIPKPPPLPPPSTASSSSSKNGEPSSPSAPFLSALHSNPKFRKSFRENEADAEERVRRVSNHTSTSSMTSVESSNQALIKPKLPPVPKSPTRSPSPQRRHDVAGISRARPSSSTSDVSKFEDDLKESKPLPPQKSLNDHTLKPNRDLPKERRPRERKAKEDDSDSDRGKQKREHMSRKASNKRDERDSDSDSIYSKDKKNTSRSRNKSRDRRDDEREDKKTRGHERKRVDDIDLERGHKKNRDGDKEHEGRFKKSAGVRKSKGKGPSKMGRSRSTGSALDDLESNQSYPQSKTTGSVRSLNFVEVDDEDLDSNYMPFKRAGSKQSLYASRTSLYGRKRKNSMGETVSLSSYRHDDLDSRLGDFDKGSLSHADKQHMFKSTGELEMRPASVFVVRECSTWTGSDKGVFVHGKRTHTKTRSVKRYNRGTQTIFSRDRRDSVGSTRSGVSSKSGISTRSNHRLKSRSKSQESLRKQKRSKSRDYSDDETSEDSRDEQHRSRKKSHKYEESDDDRKKRSRSKDKDSDSDRSSYKHSRKPKPRHRRSVDNSLEQSGSDDDHDDDATSIAASSVVPASIYQATHQPGYPTHQPGYAPQQVGYPPQFIPMGYPVAPYPQPGPGFVTAAPGGPPMMVPMNKPPIAAKPQIPPQPTASKWDQLVNLTEGMKKRRHQMGESINDTESVMSSMWSQPTPHPGHPQNYYSPPSYKTAQAMGDPNATYSTNFHESSSNQSSPNQQYGYAYLPSESNI